jgi:purine-cytosine permease-like protein
MIIPPCPLAGEASLLDNKRGVDAFAFQAGWDAYFTDFVVNLKEADPNFLVSWRSGRAGWASAVCLYGILGVLLAMGRSVATAHLNEGD